MNKALLELLYEAASIQRWNDHIRPHKGFTELDKQGHKMYFAYILGKLEEIDSGVSLDWIYLIEAGIFEFLHRIIVTDIKPPIFYKLMEKKSGELNQWVLQELNEKALDLPPGFLQKFKDYYEEAEGFRLEKRILKAAHYLATNWEFKFIYHMSVGLYGLDETKARIENEIEEHYNIAGVQKLSLSKKTSNFLDLVGQLRFQQRWAQSPRIPETSVMGHMLIVALMAYFFSVEINACPARVINNFFGGLLHDLPEVLTRDIVSPVKRAVKGLDLLIKDIESRQVEEQILPLIPKALHSQIRYYTENEFQSKIILDEKIEIVSTDVINQQYNEANFDPLDGEILRACDHLAAYLEAAISLQHGIRSNHISNAFETLLEGNRSTAVGGIDFGAIYTFFENSLEK
jgi:putative hydrolases of HD superfamily